MSYNEIHYQRNTMHYGIRITEDNLDLITFLNDGVCPRIEEKPTFFIFELNSPREITTTIVFEEELQGRAVRELLA